MGTAKPKKPSAKQKRRLMRADADARKVNGIRLKPIKHKKLYGAAARSVVESRLSPSLTLSSQFYEDKNDSKTDSKAKVKPIIHRCCCPSRSKRPRGQYELHFLTRFRFCTRGSQILTACNSAPGACTSPTQI